MTLLCLVLMFGQLIMSCSKNDDAPIVVGHRTIVAYMIGNSLESAIKTNVNDLIKGSTNLSSDNHLLIFVDMPNQSSLIIKAEKGKADTIKKYSEDLVSVNPTIISDVLNWCFSSYPSQSYGLVFATHGAGWLISSDTIPITRAKNQWVGYDKGGYRINIPSLAEAMTNLPKLDFILWDCCSMQNIEIAYELRHNAKQFIGSPAEIPNSGAPYKELVPMMFSSIGDYGSIADKYFEYYAEKNDSVPMSVINSDYLDELAAITSEKLKKIAPMYPNSLNSSEVIFYFRDNGLKIMYDMNNLMFNNLKGSLANDYTQWKTVFDKAVTNRHFCKKWKTNFILYSTDFYLFDVNSTTYGGVSMFTPAEIYTSPYSYSYDYNSDYHKMLWYWSMDWQSFGW